jgi:hypothetical protein
MEVLYIFGLIALIVLIFVLRHLIRKARAYDELRIGTGDLKEQRRNFEHEKTIFEAEQQRQIESAEKRMAEREEAVATIIREREKCFPWLAKAFADLSECEAKVIADHLQWKTHPARKAAEDVRYMGKLRREAEYRCKLAEYRVEYYEKLFPFLEDFISDGEIEDDETTYIPEYQWEDNGDRARYILSPEEYETLSDAEKYQRALDRYVHRRKSKWGIGRDYERFIGYKWEKQGYKVQYQGILEKFQDLGRDLIASKGDRIDVIQCKCWSQHKVIHEKHVYQLFATTLDHCISILGYDLFGFELAQLAKVIQSGKVQPVFVTSTVLSDTARAKCQLLNVKVFENFALADYPRVKCNVGAGDEKIYHLPFDQQYDRIIIEPEKGEFYAHTVQEAEQAGFRRAYRWRGGN